MGLRLPSVTTGLPIFLGIELRKDLLAEPGGLSLATGPMGKEASPLMLHGGKAKEGGEGG